MNLVKLYTRHGPMHIDTNQLANPNRRILTIYTARGNKLSEVACTTELREKASFGVHRDNLFASQDLADAASERIFKEMFGDKTASTSQVVSEVSA